MCQRGKRRHAVVEVTLCVFRLPALAHAQAFPASICLSSYLFSFLVTDDNQFTFPFAFHCEVARLFLGVNFI